MIIVTAPAASSSTGHGTANLFRLVRLFGLFSVGVLGLILLGLSASLIYNLGITIAMLTIFSVFPVLLMEIFNKGMLTTWTAVELGWMGVLWILWLSTGANAIPMAAGVCSPCYTGVFRYPVCNVSIIPVCAQVSALAAFSFVGFFILITLWVWTLSIAISAHCIGERQIWMMPAFQYVPKTQHDTSSETKHNPYVEAKHDTSAPPMYGTQYCS